MSKGASQNNNAHFKDRADKLMAIKRKDEFKKDYADLLEIRETGDEVHVIQKEHEIEGKWGESVLAIEKAEEWYYGQMHLPCVKAITSISKEPIRVLYTLCEEVDGEEVVIEQPFVGERLYLEVDIKHFSVKAILKDVKEIATHYKELLKDKGRYKETICDPWEIYDLRHEQKLSLLQIAKKIYGFKKNPAYDKRAKAYREQVETAYKKACRMITGVSPL